MSRDVTVNSKYTAILPFLDEKQKRLVAAGDALMLGRGKLTEISRTSGLSRTTIYKGLSEIVLEKYQMGERNEVEEAEKSKAEKDPEVLVKLEALVDPVTCGDPMAPFRWTCKSTRQLATELAKKGYDVSHTIVAEMLHDLGYSLQANVKSLEGSDHTDRDRQFRYINKLVAEYLETGHPVISLDTKKKELIAKYKNAGRTWRPEGQPEEVKCHDFIDKKSGKAIPYGVYDIGKDQGWVNVGCDADTASFAVENIRC